MKGIKYLNVAGTTQCEEVKIYSKPNLRRFFGSDEETSICNLTLTPSIP